LEAALQAQRLLSRTSEAATQTVPGMSLRCLAYALPLSLLGWSLIFFSVAVAAGYLKF
jgi:hypothetical protein